MITRTLTNGLVVIVKRNDLDTGAEMTWFEIGQLQMRQSIDPLRWIPKSLNIFLMNAIKTEDVELATCTLMKIGDFLAGWEFAVNTQEEMNKWQSLIISERKL